MKKILIIFMALLLLASCAHKKTFKRWDGKRIEAKPYGWANEQSNKIEEVKYQVNFDNLVLDIVGSEIILVPVYLTGYQFFEPVSYEFDSEDENESKKLMSHAPAARNERAFRR